uniref:Uncharacterized protein n=1 Tax=Anguilla anguilla TaxID=7936 RepID=A0A0E9TIK6_ANGAN
MHYHSLNRGRE